MSYQLKIDEMLEVLVQAGHPRSQTLVRATEVLANALATAICQHFDVRAGKAAFEGLAFAGTCVPFYGDGPLPEGMQGYDDEEEWGPEVTIDRSSLQVSYEDDMRDPGKRIKGDEV